MPNTATLERTEANEQEPTAPSQGSWKPNPAINPPLERILNPQAGDKLLPAENDPYMFSPAEVTGVNHNSFVLSSGSQITFTSWRERICKGTVAPNEYRGERTYVPVEGYTYDRFMDPQPGDRIVRPNGTTWITVEGRESDGGVRCHFSSGHVFIDTLAEWNEVRPGGRGFSEYSFAPVEGQGIAVDDLPDSTTLVVEGGESSIIVGAPVSSDEAPVVTDPRLNPQPGDEVRPVNDNDAVIVLSVEGDNVAWRWHGNVNTFFSEDLSSWRSGFAPAYGVWRDAPYVPAEDRHLHPRVGDRIERVGQYGVTYGVLHTVVTQVTADCIYMDYTFEGGPERCEFPTAAWRTRPEWDDSDFRFIPVHQVDAASTPTPAPAATEPEPTTPAVSSRDNTHCRLGPDEVAVYEVQEGDILMCNNAPWREVVSIQNDRVSQRIYEGATLEDYDTVDAFNRIGRDCVTYAYHILRLKPRSEAKFSTLKFAGSLVTLLKELATDCPCCRAVLKGFNQRNIRTSRLLNPDMPGNHFAFRENEGQVTLCPKGKEQEINADGSWSRKNRQGLKPAKWLRSMLHPKLAKRIPDHVFAKFSERFKASEEAHRVAFKFTDFDDAYNESNYDGNISSCMWNEPVDNFYGYFDCQVLVASRHGKYVGRAVVWNKVHGLDMPFMDRVYSSSPEITELFLSHAKTNGWAHKKAQSNGNMKGFVLPDGTEITKSVYVASTSNGVHHCGFFPYLDTFRRMDSDGDCHNDDNDDCGGWILNDTSGDREECEEEDNHDGEVQDVDGNWIDEDDAYNVDGDYYSSDDDRIVMCHRTDEYILRSEAMEVELSRNNTIYIHRGYVSRA